MRARATLLSLAHYYILSRRVCEIIARAGLYIYTRIDDKARVFILLFYSRSSEYFTRGAYIEMKENEKRFSATVVKKSITIYSATRSQWHASIVDVLSRSLALRTEIASNHRKIICSLKTLSLSSPRLAINNPRREGKKIANRFRNSGHLGELTRLRRECKWKGETRSAAAAAGGDWDVPQLDPVRMSLDCCCCCGDCES